MFSCSSTRNKQKKKVLIVPFSKFLFPNTRMSVLCEGMLTYTHTASTLILLGTCMQTDRGSFLFSVYDTDLLIVDRSQM